ncbi:uncharacterized protein LOC135138821 [Zophobas morio]|uniref:uncharacterized protein LOC135138821 n=1 Tax=Zophobas morio TaxID=2755281 RepID=UPI003082C714
MNSLVLCVTLLLISYDGLQSRQNFLTSSSSILNKSESPIWKKCDRRRTDFNQCLSKTIHKTLRLLDKPLKLYGLPSLYDVTFPPDAVIEFGNTTDGLRQKYHNYRIIGLTKPRSIRARLDSGVATNTLTIETTYSKLVWKCECEANGTLVLLPLNVRTPLEFTFDNPTFIFAFELEEYEKAAATYFRVIESAFDARARDIRFDFKHLFSNTWLNDEFNSELSAKGSQMYALVKHYEAIFAPYFGSVFNSFLEKVPVVELFDG